jgi:polar amino acid transport system ATP-binding protein
VDALVDVSLSIAAGEVVVVIGPSGSGKSTLLRCLNRLETADSGHIFIDGVDVLDPKTDINRVRAEVGMVFQSFNLFPHKTVFDNITLAQRVVRRAPGRRRCRRPRPCSPRSGSGTRPRITPTSSRAGSSSG